MLVPRERRELPVTLPCGKPARQGNQRGPVPGVKEDLVGILNALSWPGWCDSCSTLHIIIISTVCSDILGERADIHTGGVDLKFPHHDNEIAQAEVRRRGVVCLMSR